MKQLMLNKTYLGRTIPFEWVITSIRNNSASYRHLISFLTVTESIHTHNGERWLHVSLSHAARVPTWGELQTVKSIWIGDKVAYHVLPHAVKPLSDDEYTIHIWCPLDNDPFPFEMQRGAA
jgi:hypothetical protein